LVFALSAILIAGIGASPIFGQIAEPIMVTTDKASYSSGETIVISGEVKELLSGYPVSVTVISPNNNIVAIAQVEVGADRTFSTEVTAGGTMKVDGTYTIRVLYGTESRTAEATFDFGGSGTITPPPPKGPKIMVERTEFSVGYSITGGSITSIAPDDEANSLIITIDSTDDGQLTITLPRALIDAKIGSEDDDYFVLVDGEEVGFEETTTSKDRTLTIQFPSGAEEIEIIGTFVIPEFGTIALLILAVAIVSIIAVSSRSRLSIMSKY
jgi:predicted secreted protein with PEFG-CTERM motif